jgi:enamine deaminase RidA (YjgF/YER057c/UK114 family)
MLNSKPNRTIADLITGEAPHVRTQSNDRRAFLAGALACVAGLATASAAEAETKSRPVGLYPAEAPAADSGYTPGILAEGRKMVFVSGQGPRDRNADMETQMRQTFEAIGKVLQTAGASMKDIVILRSYFVNIARDLPVYRKVRKDYLSKPYPASTAVGVPALAMTDLQIEIEAVALI